MNNTENNIFKIYDLSCNRDELDTNILNINLILKNDAEFKNICHFDKLSCDDESGFNIYTVNEFISVLNNIVICFKTSKIRVIFNGAEPLVYAKAIRDFIYKFKNNNLCQLETHIITPLLCEIENVCELLDKIDKWYIIIDTLDNKIYYAKTGYQLNNTKANLAILSDCVNKNKINILMTYDNKYLFETMVKDYNQLSKIGFNSIKAMGVK